MNIFYIYVNILCAVCVYTGDTIDRRNFLRGRGNTRKFN
jgi:hypothetical protein